MWQLGSIAFLQPWILAALVSLPVLWWLLRVTPPAPQRISFPPLSLLRGLAPAEKTPSHTPWWLLLLRLLAAALIIVGLAQPLMNPSTQLSPTGTLLLVIDDGWAAGRHWQARLDAALKALDEAERHNKPVRLLTTAPDSLDDPITLSGVLTAPEARKVVQGLTPKPWPTNHATALAALEGVQLQQPAQALWLSDGLADDSIEPLADELARHATTTVLRDAETALSRLLLAPVNDGTALVLRVQRPATGLEDIAAVVATADDGSLVGRSALHFPVGEAVAEARLDLPSELRNRIARLSIEGETQAGAVLLMDERWRRRPVGLVSDSAVETAQPLLSELYYLERALEPFTELRQGSIDELLERKLAVIVLPDVGTLAPDDEAALTTWVEQGGLLLRFGGPRLSENQQDPLLPVTLRGGGRILGGVMTWDTPAALSPFDDKSPFADFAVPEDVRINSQVLAEPSLDLAEKTWAKLSDGTPLITSEPRGEGRIVLVHTTANTQWSNLAISGLFVDLLKRLVNISQGVQGDGDSSAPLAPIQILDGFGRLQSPPPTVVAVAPALLEEGNVGPRSPPGYYGELGYRQALNLSAAVPGLEAIEAFPSSVSVAVYSGSEEQNLQPWLLTAALVLLLLDLFIALSFRGLLTRALRPAAVAFLAIALFHPDPSLAQSSSDDSYAKEASLETRLAFVKTGVADVDATSRAGLTGLSRILRQRTSVDAGEPMGVDLDRDELAFFPLLYWPITPQQPTLSETAREKIRDYVRHGGTILIDQRQSGPALQVPGGDSRQSQALKRLTEGLEIPALIPVPPEHVMTKSFYLMQDFPGRYAGGALWVGATDGHVNDGVASFLIGANDWASAWAVNDQGLPLFAVFPGGERQRELAFRVGVNLVMYALTGNYKADQVHVPFILERLGQ